MQFLWGGRFFSDEEGTPVPHSQHANLRCPPGLGPWARGDHSGPEKGARLTALRKGKGISAALSGVKRGAHP